MNILKTHITSTAVLLFLHCSQAVAGTVSYNFVDPGWINQAGVTENFAGSFIGTPEASGVIALGDLTTFIGFFTETNAQNETKTISTFGDPAGTTGVTQFFFDPNANTLTLAANGTPGAQICLGDSVAQGVCGPIGPRPLDRNGNPAPPIQGLFISLVNGSLSSSDTDLPSITLVQSPFGIAPQPVQSSAPEPGTSFLCGGALVLISLGLRKTSSRKGTQMNTD